MYCVKPTVSHCDVTDSKDQAARDDREGGMNRWSTEEFQGSETAL